MQNLFTITVQVVLTNPLINLFVYQHIEFRKLSSYNFLEVEAKLDSEGTVLNEFGLRENRPL